MLKDKIMHFCVKFIFKDIEEAIKVRNLLKKYKFEVSVIVNHQITYTNRKKRLKIILDYLDTKTRPITIGNLYGYYHRHSLISYKTLQRDIAILILQNKINAKAINNKISRGRTTLIEIKK